MLLDEYGGVIHEIITEYKPKFQSELCNDEMTTEYMQHNIGNDLTLSLGLTDILYFAWDLM